LIFVQTEGALIAILQRLLVCVISAWLIMVAFRVRSIAARKGTVTFFYAAGDEDHNSALVLKEYLEK
jgi:hypothetical protein